MGFLEDTGWILWIEALGLLALAGFLVFAAWWALFSDRPRGRRRCPQCWYDVTHSPGMTCPECGFVARAERELHQRRRRGWAGILAILGCVMVGLYGGERLMDRGWTGYLPTWSVILAVPLTDDNSGAIYRELDRRVRAGRITDSQWLSLLKRCAVGDGGARPPSDAWLGKYARLIRAAAARAREHEDPQWRRAVEAVLLTVPPRVDMTTRDDWPIGVGATLDVRAQTWWPRGMQCRITSEPDLPGARAAVHVLRDAPIQLRSYSVLLPPLDAGRYDVGMNVTVERRVSNEEAWQPVSRQTLDVPVTVRGHLEETLAAARGQDLDAAISHVFNSRLVQYRDGSLPVRVRVNQHATAGELFKRTAIAVRVEVRRNGRPGRHLDIWWRGGTGGVGERLAWEVPMHDDDVLLPPAVPEDEWSLHVRSVPELALRVDGVTRFWEGEVTIEVGVRSQATSAPPRGWLAETPDG
ncbi:MAG: hypothetical protein GY715_13450 [Planctomycetes bacterium]|nr:hypothetical protein [Planctomycetota bacterium]